MRVLYGTAVDLGGFGRIPAGYAEAARRKVVFLPCASDRIFMHAHGRIKRKRRRDGL